MQSLEGAPLTVAVLGASGHAGAELCRLLLGHPGVGTILPLSRSREPFERMHPNLLGSGLEYLSEDTLETRAAEIDIAFMCTPAGEAMRRTTALLESGVRVIDLGPDFRFRDPAAYRAVYGGEHAAPGLLAEAVYGVTELRREDVRGARLVANPGCFAITVLLAIAPLVAAKWLDMEQPVRIAALNGMTGAGSTPRRELMFAESSDAVLPYSMEGHRHGPEIEAQLRDLCGAGVTIELSTAHVGAVRGIYAQITMTARSEYQNEIDREMLLETLRRFYGTDGTRERFVAINAFAKHGGVNAKEYDVYPRMHSVLGSNYCHLGVDYDRQRRAVKVMSVTDNLGKGAAGSALQNMNVMCGFDEATGIGHYGL